MHEAAPSRCGRPAWRVLRAADDGVAALAEGFQLARNDLSRRQESARREVFDALLAGGAEAAAVLGRAADLGLDLAAPHAVLVVAGTSRSFEGDRCASLLGRLERALQGRYGDAGVLLAVKGGDAGLHLRRARRATRSPRRGSARSGADRRRTAGPAGGARSGARGPGPDGVRAPTSRRATPWTSPSGCGLPGPVVDAGALVVYRVLLRDREALDELDRGRLGPLPRPAAAPARCSRRWTPTTRPAVSRPRPPGGCTCRCAPSPTGWPASRELLGIDPTDPARAVRAAGRGARGAGAGLAGRPADCRRPATSGARTVRRGAPVRRGLGPTTLEGSPPDPQGAAVLDVPFWAWVGLRRRRARHARGRPARPPRRPRDRLPGGRLVERRLGRPVPGLRRRRLGDPRHDGRRGVHDGLAAREEPVGRQPLRLRPDLRLLQVPRAYQHRVLFFGVLGALVFRGIFLAAGVAVVNRFTAVLFGFAAVLLYSAWKLLKDDDDSYDPGTSVAVRMLRKVVPVRDEYAGTKFFVKEAGRRVATPLLAVVVAHRGGRPGLRRRQRAGRPGGQRRRLHRLHQQRLRHPRPAGAVLPALRPAGPVPLPQHRPGAHPRLHRRQADPAGLPQDDHTSIPEIPSLVSLAVIVLVLAASIVLSLRLPAPEDRHRWRHRGRTYGVVGAVRSTPSWPGRTARTPPATTVSVRPG